jgi:hypothetical protein
MYVTPKVRLMHVGAYLNPDVVKPAVANPDEARAVSLGAHMTPPAETRIAVATAA